MNAYRLPSLWLPDAKMIRVIGHWTAGSYIASSLDREHYHFLIQGSLDVIRGRHPVSANQVIGSKSPNNYAAHTSQANTRAIGVAMCASAGAAESPFNPGKFPVTEAQWQRFAEVIACCCIRYKISVTNKTVLTHAEVQENLGIRQNGKWDIAKLDFGTGFTTAKACGDNLRLRVQKVMT